MFENIRREISIETIRKTHPAWIFEAIKKRDTESELIKIIFLLIILFQPHRHWNPGNQLLNYFIPGFPLQPVLRLENKAMGKNK